MFSDKHMPRPVYLLARNLFIHCYCAFRVARADYILQRLCSGWNPRAFTLPLYLEAPGPPPLESIFAPALATAVQRANLL